MPKRPSFQFYPGDWRRDAALQSCTVGARGLWIEIMCLMHEGTPYGHLQVNLKVILTPNLARMVGATSDECEGWIGELEEAGVLSKTEDGTIYSRRMVKDENLRQRRAAGGSLGGNPALMKERKVNLPPTSGVTSGVTPASSSAVFISEDPPLTPQGANKTGSAPKKKSGPKGKNIPKVVIPPELEKIGIDAESFEERVRNRPGNKPLSAWQKELDRLAPLIEKCGRDIVFEVWEDASAGGWLGCTPAQVRERARKSGQRWQEPTRGDTYRDL